MDNQNPLHNTDPSPEQSTSLPDIVDEKAVSETLHPAREQPGLLIETETQVKIAIERDENKAEQETRKILISAERHEIAHTTNSRSMV